MASGHLILFTSVQFKESGAWDETFLHQHILSFSFIFTNVPNGLQLCIILSQAIIIHSLANESQLRTVDVILTCSFILIGHVAAWSHSFLKKKVSYSTSLLGGNPTDWSLWEQRAPFSHLHIPKCCEVRPFNCLFPEVSSIVYALTKPPPSMLANVWI